MLLLDDWIPSVMIGDWAWWSACAHADAAASETSVFKQAPVPTLDSMDFSFLKLRGMFLSRFASPPARHIHPFLYCLNAAVRSSPLAHAALAWPCTPQPAASSRCFGSDSGTSKPMSFIEKAKLLGANAILGAMTHQGGFDSALQGMNIDRIDNGYCEASVVVTSNLANA
jgi:hypothetical protein